MASYANIDFGKLSPGDMPTEVYDMNIDVDDAALIYHGSRYIATLVKSRSGQYTIIWRDETTAYTGMTRQEANACLRALDAACAPIITIAR